MSQLTTRRKLLIEAADAVDGDRDAAYGGPEDSFRTIAALWNLYLDAKMGDLQAHDIAAMMILFKVARIVGSRGTHRDSWVDAAGYAACGYECAAKETGE